MTQSSGLFAIVGMQRSGTIALSTALEQHVDIHMWPEVFLNFPNGYENFFDFWDTEVGTKRATTHPEYFRIRALLDKYIDLLRGYVSDKPLHGLNIKYDQFNYVPELRKHLREKGLMVLHVIRNDALDTALSQITLERRYAAGLTAHTRTDAAEGEVLVEVPPAEVMARKVSEIVEWVRRERSLLCQDFPTCEVIYERAYSDEASFGQALATSLAHIGAEPADLTPKIKKSSPKDYRAYVTNAHEIDKLVEMLEPHQRYVLNEPA